MPTPPANAARNTTPHRAPNPAIPPKAAKAIIAAVDSEQPPAFLLLGNGALNTYRRLTEARLDTLIKCEHLTPCTDIDA
jgi:hypothetical protein